MVSVQPVLTKTSNTVPKLILLVQFSFFINGNAELLRANFVAHSGQKGLRVVLERSPNQAAVFCRAMVNEINKNVVDPTHLVISIIAGARIEKISKELSNELVVRAMPNTPSQIGAGMTAWTCSVSVDEAHRSQVRTMLSASLRGVIAQLLLKKADGGGRVAVNEILVASSAVSAIIREGATQKLEDVIVGGKSQGMQFMDDAIWYVLQQGIVSPHEAYMKSIDKNRFRKFLPPEDEGL